MQGIFMHGSRPQTKKVFKEVVESIKIDPDPNHREDNKEHVHDGYCVVIEATSFFGNEFDGSLAQAMNCQNEPCAFGNHVQVGPVGHHNGPFTVVGPDPRTARKWYATVEFDSEANRWRVK